MALTPERLVRDLQAPFDAQVAPDGSLVLFALTWAEGDRNRSRLATCARDGSSRMPLCEEPGEQHGGRWSPDSRRVAFACDEGEQGHGLFVVQPGGRSRRLATSEHPISGIAWSADAGRIAYCTAMAEGVDTPVVRVTRRSDYKLDGRGYLGDRREQVFVVELAGGPPRQLTHGLDHGAPAWAPDGSRLAAIASRAASSQLALVDVDGGETLLGPDPGSVTLHAWSPGGRLLVVADPQRTYQPDFFVLEPGARELRRVTDDLPMLPHGGYPGWMPPSPPAWLDDRRVLFHGLRAGRSGLWLLDTESGATERVAEWDAVHAGFSVDAGRRWAVQVAAGPVQPPELYVHDLEGRRGTVVSAFGAALNGASAPSVERFRVPRAGLEIDGWLLRPPGFDAARRYPVVLDIHGGPNMWYGENWVALQQLLAANGYLVAYSNPRGSSSYGRDFTGRVFRDWGGEDYLDLMAVMDEVLRRPYADATRTGVFGYSYGGYMTSWILGHTDRFRAAVVGAPCFDLPSMWGTSDIGAVWDDVQWGGSPLESPDFYRDRSPSTHIHRATTPTLVVHGEADERCPIGQGEELYTWLHEAGVEAQFARYPGASHLFPFTGRPPQREDFLGRVLAWFDAHLKEG